MSTQVIKNLFGQYTIKYDCPHCKSRLTSPLGDAGKPDSCPDCGAVFKVPGAEERDRLLAEQQAKAKRHAEERERVRQDRAQKKASEQAEIRELLANQRRRAEEQQRNTLNQPEHQSQTRRCPYCAEEILKVAKKCRYCREYLDSSTTGSASNRSDRNRVGKWLWVVPICLIVLIGLSSSQKPIERGGSSDGMVSPSAALGNSATEAISREQYGDAWPLKVDSGILQGKIVGHTSKGQTIAEVTFTAHGITYGVNGIARSSRKFKDITTIWDNDSSTGLKKDIGPIIKRGVQLAESGSQSSSPGESSSSHARDKKWYEGGTLHYKTVKEWKRSNDADKLATCADCLALLASEGVLDPARFSLHTPDSVRPHAEQMVRLVDAAITARSISVDSGRHAVHDGLKVYEVISICVIANAWDRK